MKILVLTCALFTLTILVCNAAAEPITEFLQPPVVDQGKDKDQPKKKDKDKDKKLPDKDKKLTEPPKTDVFASAPNELMGPQFPTGFNPNMMGDFVGTFSRQNITVFGILSTTTTRTTTRIIKNPDGGTAITIVTTTSNTTKTPVSQTRTIVVNTGSALGAFKIAENESPRPVDRVFFTYNYFGNIQGVGSPPNNASSFGQTVSNTASLGPVSVANSVATSGTFPATPRTSANLQREVLGFEKTFLDGNASFEMRVPLLQNTSNLNGFNASNIADLTFITKYAVINDRETGNVLSGGLVVTAPTGPAIVTTDGNIHSTLLQPWFGYIWNSDRFFLQAFHSLVAPTDPRDVTMFFNDASINYWLYRGQGERRIRFLVPMLEAHVTTPLNHRDFTGPIFVPDIVIMTGGLHVGLPGNAILSIGVASPVTGPRVFGAESFVQLNWRF